MPLDKFYKVSEEEGLHLDHELIEPLLKKTGLLHGQNNLVNYYGFVNLIDTTHPLPNLGKIQGWNEICLIEIFFKFSHFLLLFL